MAPNVIPLFPRAVPLAPIVGAGAAEGGAALGGGLGGLIGLGVGLAVGLAIGAIWDYLNQDRRKIEVPDWIGLLPEELPEPYPDQIIYYGWEVYCYFPYPTMIGRTDATAMGPWRYCYSNSQEGSPELRNDGSFNGPPDDGRIKAGSDGNRWSWRGSPSQLWNGPGGAWMAGPASLRLFAVSVGSGPAQLPPAYKRDPSNPPVGVPVPPDVAPAPLPAISPAPSPVQPSQPWAPADPVPDLAPGAPVPSPGSPSVAPVPLPGAVPVPSPGPAPGVNPGQAPVPSPGQAPAPGQAPWPGQTPLRGVPWAPSVPIGPDGRPVLPPAPGPEPTPVWKTFEVGDPIGSPANAPRPGPEAMAAELGRLEEKAAGIFRRVADNAGGGGVDVGGLLQLLRQVYDLLAAREAADTYFLHRPCGTGADGGPLPPIEYPIPEQIGASGSIIARLDAIAKMINDQKQLRGLVGKSDLIGQPVTVTFVEQD